jgi:3-hydroxybutyryl-CoA dehydrogenase
MSQSEGVLHFGSDLRVAVVGAGLMGTGVAHVFADAGHQVHIFDRDPEVSARAPDQIRSQLSALGADPSGADRVRPTTDLEPAVRGASLVIECVREDLATKKELFKEIEPLVWPNTVLATNTSVIPIGQIMQGLVRPERALGMHWWNPAYLVPLVEVIGTERTAEEVVVDVISLLSAIGKVPVRVRRDIPGFIGNRLQHAMWREAIALVADGVCDAETIDLVVKNSFGMRLGILGPMENADLIGLDLVLAAHATLFPDLTRDAVPSPLLEALVTEGDLGMKAGKGFFDWPSGEQERVRSSLIDHLLHSDGGDARSCPSNARSAAVDQSN